MLRGRVAGVSRSKKRGSEGRRRGGRSDEANTAGAILLCCRSGDPFQLSSDYSRRLFFLPLLVARLTPANFQAIAQSVVYLAFISISHGPPPPPQPTEVLSSIPFLRTRVSRVAEQTWLKNYSSNYNYPETKLSRH